MWYGFGTIGMGEQVLRATRRRHGFTLIELYIKFDFWHGSLAISRKP